DLGWIVESLLSRDLRHRHYNVCTGQPFDLVSLAGKVSRASGKDLPILVKSDGLAPEYWGQNARLLEELPDFHFREIDDSIARLYSWYEARKASIDPQLLRFDE